MKTQVFFSALVMCLVVFTHSYTQTSIDSHYEAAEELLELCNMESALQELINSSLQIQLDTNPELLPYKDVLQEFLLKHLSWHSVKDAFIQIYVESFTEKELRDISDFYRTDTGKKAMQLMPELFNKGALLGQQKVEENSTELIQMIEKRQKELEEESNASPDS
jgi:hypothetical protein